MTTFELDPRIDRETLLVTDLGLTQLRLMNDRRFFWLMLVPKRPDITEVHELSPLDQTMLTFETAQIARTLKTVTDADKINVAALGNKVRQLHVHVIARFEGDPAWPDPVWSAGAGEPYRPGEAQAFIDRFSAAF
ncbi:MULTISPECIES: HIT family protein [unclassified Roseitalea]|uniref:HIT family protein n=1 Tax=unclassified Roseitalea TaxID=2639107 RepID=UPI00273F1347|nr:MULTISPECIES: HIT family protein [unclassified Roseitalea]